MGRWVGGSGGFGYFSIWIFFFPCEQLDFLPESLQEAAKFFGKGRLQNQFHLRPIDQGRSRLEFARALH